MTTHMPSRGDTIGLAVPKEHAVLPGRGGHDDPVAPPAGEHVTVDGDGDSRLTGAGHAREDDVVERGGGPEVLARQSGTGHAHSVARLDLVVAATEHLTGRGSPPRFAIPATDPLCRARNTVPSPTAGSSTSHSDAGPTRQGRHRRA